MRRFFILILLISFFILFLKSRAGLTLSDSDRIRVEPWISDLEIPWSLIFLPDRRAIVSERPGRIRLIKDGKIQKEPYAVIDNVLHIGEGGLMGLAAHPDFPQKPYIYAMHTYKKGDSIFNRVIRLKDCGTFGRFDMVIIDGIPGGRLHNGGRIAFGPDRMLYITTGEIFDADLAQNLKSLGGKILRVTPDGEIPPDNPFKNSPVYSYGHRNPQGLAWHPETGELFSSEHGPSGEFLRFGNDEINVIKKGGNYGWPEVIGIKKKSPYIDPLILWEKTTPPSGMTFYTGDKLPYLKGDLFVATLRSECIVRIRLKKGSDGYKVLMMERWFENKYGRIRDVIQGPDGYIYFLTNNRDGRGKPRQGDDRIYKILPGSE
ncbi:MAG: PQQ-dependent sugar dehydrogenase [Thermodesulfovibrionales bacterium]